MKQNWLKAILPHLAAIGIFLLLAFVYCSPVLEGKVVNQGDMKNVQGMAKEAKDYYEATGERPLWTNSMFSGMPSYVIYTGPGTNKIAYFNNKIVSLYTPAPVNMLFLAMLCMYILLFVLDFKYWIRILGAIAFAFCSYNVIIIDVGHITKMYDIALMPAVMGGIILTYRGKLLQGMALTALATAMLIYNNHLQIIYYALIMVLCLAIGAFVHAYREKQLPLFFKASGLLVIAGVLAVLTSMDSLMILKEYTDYTMRGSHSELTLDKEDVNQKKTTGLDIDYAYDWSYGKAESGTFLIPGYVGNSSGQRLGIKSNFGKEMVQLGIPETQVEQILDQQMKVPLYYGAQSKGTSGPVYVGAIICFLFVLSLLLVRDWLKWWLLAISIIGFVLAWGKNLGFINDFLFYHLPLYNKFRAPAQALVIPSFAFVVLACYGLQEIANGLHSKEQLLAALKKALYITGGAILGFVIIGNMIGFASASDAGMLQYFSQIFGGEENGRRMIRALENDRSSLLYTDSLRSAVFILIAAAVIWAFIKDKLKWQPAILILTAAVTIDLVAVDRNYLNKESFVDDMTFMQELQPTAADQQIKQDPDPYYRVLNVTTSPFDDASPSYFHKNIGGYSPAKLWIYQDLISHQIAKNNMKVLSMLNTKYFIVPDQKGQPIAQRNPDAYGNAWFVKDIVWAPDANTEMSTLDYLNTRDSAVIDQRYKSLVGDLKPGADSSASIKLTKYGLNKLEYAAHNTADGFGVFSEIYYPAGWEAFVDGKPAEIIRTNYALRGIKIPAGDHKVEMKFEPKTYFKGLKIAGISSTLLILLVLGIIVYEIYLLAAGKKTV